MPDDLKDSILSAFEASLDAQLRAVRRLRRGSSELATPPSRSRLSQVDMAYNILKMARSPLHIAEILARLQSTYDVAVDRESLVSSLAKKVARGDRFLRSGKNTFALRAESSWPKLCWPPGSISLPLGVPISPSSAPIGAPSARRSVRSSVWDAAA